MPSEDMAVCQKIEEADANRPNVISLAYLKINKKITNGEKLN
jgi:hypothetical protein